MTVSIFLLFVLPLAIESAFFDITDVDDPLALLWHTKDAFVSPKDKECTVRLSDNATLSGVCKHKTHCYLSGGSIQGHGSCGILQTCCTYQRSCRRTTKAKISYFTSGSHPSQECDYVVEAENENICQIRLDFEIFRLNPATVTAIDAANRAYRCSLDALTVHPNTYNIPRFCGFNDGQHVYIHLHHEKKIRLSMHFANRSVIPLNIDNNNLQIAQNPQWKIKVTQLECPGKQSFFDKHKNWNAIDDFNLLAPRGAIQYFTEPSGRFRSFGFDGRSGNYENNLKYVAAFKKRPETCLKFTSSNYFNIRSDVNCDQDYLFVPELSFDSSTQNGVSTDDKSLICGSQLDGTIPVVFTSKTPGPFYVEFVSQPTIQPPIINDLVTNAFDLQYEMFKCSV